MVSLAESKVVNTTFPETMPKRSLEIKVVFNLYYTLLYISKCEKMSEILKGNTFRDSLADVFIRNLAETMF